MQEEEIVQSSSEPTPDNVPRGYAYTVRWGAGEHFKMEIKETPLDAARLVMQLFHNKEPKIECTTVERF